MSSKGVSGQTLAEGRAVDDRIAWVMGRRIRRMLAEPPWSTLSDRVEADAMGVGGRKKPEDDDPGPSSGGSTRGCGAARVPALVVVERDGGARAIPIAAPSSQTVGAIV